jgi:phosphopantetheine--protein transferase-like protein
MLRNKGIVPDIEIDVSEISGTTTNDKFEIGIDIENISNLPTRNENNQFYLDIFTSEEINYCELKKEPIRSFAGIFSLKEAIVKADNSLRSEKFNKIGIGHSDEGKPTFQNFDLSVSHAGDIVVSVAVKNLGYKEVTSINNNKLKDNTLVKLNSRDYFTKYQVYCINLISIFIAVFITLLLN